MYCRNCGTPYSGGVVCERCGTRYTDEELNEYASMAGKAKSSKSPVVIILIIVAFFRELLGSGTLLGFNILNYECLTDAGYMNNGLMLMPPMALIIVACIIWVHRSRNKDLQEK